MTIQKTLFSRILKIFILMSIGALVLTMAINTFVSRIYFRNRKVNEIQPTLTAVESLVNDVENNVLDYAALERFIFAQTVDKNIQIVIANEFGHLLYASKGVRDERMPDNNAPNISMSNNPDASMDFNDPILFQNILSTSDTFVEIMTFEGSEVETLVIGQTIKNDSSVVIGAVAAIVPVYELDEAVYTLMISLSISMAAVMVVSVFVLYLFSKKLTTPIHTMMHVANAMSEGRFDAKADENDPSEIGALGHSLNRMSASLKFTMDEITSERSKLELMLLNMKEGVISFDLEGNILISNPSMYRLLEVDTKEELVDIFVKENILKDIKDALKGKSKTTEFRLNNLEIGLSVSPIFDAQNIVSGAVAVFTDQSEAVRLEQMRRDYVANVSHELRTPITAMRAFIEPLNDNLINDEAKKHEYYNNILKEIERLNRLINDLLELSRLQNTQETFKKSEVNLKDFVRGINDRYQFLAQEKGLDFKTEFSVKKEVINSSEDRLEQVLTILLDNALKYTEKGFIGISVRDTDDDLVFEIKDTGLGIAQKDLPFIFERFYTVDKARTYKSFGLGLSIAKEIVDHLNAQISVASKLNEGTTFTLRIQKAS